MTDEEVAVEVQKGKVDVFGEVVRRYERRLYGYLRNLTNRQREEVEDMLQEVFIKSYVNIQGFEVKKKFSSWIFRIAHNVAIDYMKKKTETKITTDNEDFWENVEDKRKLVEELMVEKEETKQLALALEKLEIKYREPILLYYFEDKSYDEIAEVLQTSISNVGAILNRARGKLKEDLRSKI